MRPDPTASRGSITLVALCLAIVMGISLASYLALCYQSLQLSTRTMHLSRAKHLAETGLEEALWSLNAWAHPSGAIRATAWTNATWSTSGLDRSCTIAGSALGNGASGSVVLTIRNFDGPTVSPSLIPAPIITATATVGVPGAGTFTKTLSATAKPAPFFVNAVGVIPPANPVAAGTSYAISFNAGGMVDSWDSDFLANAPTGTLPVGAPNRDYVSTTAYAAGTNPGTIPSPTNPYPIASPSTYPDLSYHFSAIVAAPNLKLLDTDLRGYAMTYGNSINTNIGTKIRGPSALGTSTTIDASRVGKSAFIPKYAVTNPTPPGAWNMLPWSNTTWGGPSASQTIGNPAATSPTYYRTNLNEGGIATLNNNGLPDFLLTDSQTLVIDGPVVLHVDEDFELRNDAKIIITATGRLELNIRDDVLISGNAGFQNSYPKNLAVFLLSNTSGQVDLDYTSTADFTGVIYSADPDETLRIASSPNFFGAILANYSVTFAGAPQIHYDTALRHLPRRWFTFVATPFLLEQIIESP